MNNHGMENTLTQKNMFDFILKPIAECALPGDEVKNIWWFYLTDSWYAINLGEVHLFESSSAHLQKYEEHPLLDYYYIRWLEDFFDILPEIAISIPQDLYALISSEEKRTSTNNQLIDFLEKHENENGDVPEEVEEIYLMAQKIVYHGVVDTGFLRFKSLCRFCRLNRELIVHYDFRDKNEEGTPPWSAGVGQYSMGYEIFVQEIDDMLNRFFDAMEQQIAYAVETARKNPGQYIIDGNNIGTTPEAILALLQKEQARRKKYFYDLLASIKNKKEHSLIYWDEIRQALEQVGLLPKENIET